MLVLLKQMFSKYPHLKTMLEEDDERDDNYNSEINDPALANAEETICIEEIRFA